MDNIQSDIAKALDAQAVKYDILKPSDTTFWQSEIRRVFCDPKLSALPIWEALIGEKSFSDETVAKESNRLLNSIDQPIVVLIDDWHGWTGFNLPSGRLFAEALEHTYQFEWYATDRILTKLVCRNDHDVVTFSEISTVKRLIEE